MSSSVPIPGSLPPDIRQRLADYPFEPPSAIQEFDPMVVPLSLRRPQEKRPPERIRKAIRIKLKSLDSVDGRYHRWLRDNPEHAAWLKANVEERLWDNLKASEKEWEDRVANGVPNYCITPNGETLDLD